MAEYLIFALAGYLLGSLPFGLITGRVFSQVDVREHGSGMTGMTNVMRTAGAPAGIVVLLLDMGKTILVATHDLPLIRAAKNQVQARVLRISNRQLISAGADL